MLVAFPYLHAVIAEVKPCTLQTVLVFRLNICNNKIVQWISVFLVHLVVCVWVGGGWGRRLCSIPVLGKIFPHLRPRPIIIMLSSFTSILKCGTPSPPSCSKPHPPHPSSSTRGVRVNIWLLTEVSHACARQKHSSLFIIKSCFVLECGIRKQCRKYCSCSGRSRCYY